MERQKLTVEYWNGLMVTVELPRGQTDEEGTVRKSVKERYKSGWTPEPLLYIVPGESTRIINIGDVLLTYGRRTLFNDGKYLQEWDGL